MQPYAKKKKKTYWWHVADGGMLFQWTFKTRICFSGRGIFFFICYTELCNFTCVWLSKYVELCNCSSAPFNSSTECSGHIYYSSFWDVQKIIGVITGSKFDCVIFYTLQATDRFVSFVLFLGFKRWMKPHALCRIPAHFLPYLTERQKGVFDFSPEKISWMFTLLGATRFWPSVLIMRKSRSKP